MAKIFFDANILVYTVDRHDAEKQKAARNVLRKAVEEEVPVISTQVIQEFYSAVTARLNMDKIAAKSIVHNLHRIEIVQINLNLIEQGIDISILSQLSFWDGLIIAAAEQANCSVIYSEDLTEGQVIRGVRVVNPFAVH